MAYEESYIGSLYWLAIFESKWQTVFGEQYLEQYLKRSKKVISYHPAVPGGRRRRIAVREGGKYYKNIVLRKILIFNYDMEKDKYLT